MAITFAWKKLLRSESQITQEEKLPFFRVGNLRGNRLDVTGQWSNLTQRELADKLCGNSRQCEASGGG